MCMSFDKFTDAHKYLQELKATRCADVYIEKNNTNKNFIVHWKA